MAKAPKKESKLSPICLDPGSYKTARAQDGLKKFGLVPSQVPKVFFFSSFSSVLFHSWLLLPCCCFIHCCCRCYSCCYCCCRCSVASFFTRFRLILLPVSSCNRIYWIFFREPDEGFFREPWYDRKTKLCLGFLTFLIAEVIKAGFRW